MATANDVSKSSDDSLENLVKCAICLDYYKDPRVLPCSHTFCYQCLKSLCRERPALCPMRDNTTIMLSSIDRLPVNRTAKDLVDHIAVAEKEKSSAIAKNKCDDCTIISADYYCDKCSKHYCTTCLKIRHTPQDLETHKMLILIHDNIDVLCSQHVEEKRKYYCKQCEEMVCSDCLLFEHKNHAFVSLTDIAQTTRQEFHASLDQLSSIKNNLQNFLSTASEAFRTIYDAHLKTKYQIEKTISNLQSALEIQKQTLIAQLQKEDVDHQKMIQREINDAQEQLKTILIRIMFTKQICAAPDNYQVMRMKNDLITYNSLLDEQHEEMTSGCFFNTTNFDWGNNLSEIKNLIQMLGEMSLKTFLFDSQRIYPVLNISKSSVTDAYMKVDGRYAYGYRFQLVEPIKFQAIRIKATVFDTDVSVYILDFKDIVISMKTIHAKNQNLPKSKWFIIPMKYKIENNYYILIWLKPNGNQVPLIAYQFGNHCLRIIDKKVSVRSKRAKMNASTIIQVGNRLGVVYDALLHNDDNLEETVPCIDMMLDI